MNFVPKEKSKEAIGRILAKRQREIDERLAEKRREYSQNKNKE